MNTGGIVSGWSYQPLPGKGDVLSTGTGGPLAGPLMENSPDSLTLSSPSQPGEKERTTSPSPVYGHEEKPEVEYSFSPPQSAQPAGPAPVTFGIIHVNDEHDNTFRKFPRESTIVRQREAHYGDDHSFIVNLGDVTYNGNTKEKGPHFFGPIAQILDSEHIEYYVPGNHDLDHGGKYLENQVLSRINAKALVANLHYATGKLLEDTVPYVIEEIEGVKVGLIGLTTPKLKETGKVEGGPVAVEPLMESAEKYVAEAREKGADVVVLMMHEGVNTARAIAGAVPGIDMIIAGHDHKKCAEVVKNPDGRDTVVVEAGGNANYVGDAAITVDPSCMKVLKIDYRLYSTSGVEPDPEVAEIIAKYKGM